MAQWILTVFLSLFFTFSAVAAENCSPRTEAIAPIVDLVNKSCDEVKASAQCQKVYDEIKQSGGNFTDRALLCNGDQSQSWLSSSADWATGCMIGVGDYFIKLGTSIGETAAQIMLNREEKQAELAACNIDIKKKKILYEDYNARMPRVLQVSEPTEAELQSLTCEKIQIDLVMQQRKLSLRAFNKVRARLNDRTATYTPDEQQFVDWTIQTNKPKLEANVIDLAKAHLKKLGLQYECYNSKYQKALMCEALAEVAPTLWGAAKAGAAAVKAARAQRLARLAGVKNVDDFVADVNAAERATDGPAGRITNPADRERILARAAGLSNEERIMALEKLRGRPLSQREADQWIKMHEVGTADGRGFGTYTPDDIAAKQRLANEINPDTGKPYFSNDEIKIGLRNGITGTLSSVQKGTAREIYAVRAAKEDYSQYHRLHAEAAAGEGKIAEAADAYNRSYRAYVKETGVDLRDASSARRTLAAKSERELMQLEDAAASSGQVQQMNEITKARWTQIERDIKRNYSNRPGYQNAVNERIQSEYSNLLEQASNRNPLVKKAAEEKIKAMRANFPGLR